MASASHPELLAVAPRREVRPARDAALLSAGYLATAAGWLVVSGVLLWSDVVVTARARSIVVVNGTLFIAFTTSVLFMVLHRHLARLRDAQKRFDTAQAELREQDLAVRQGYVDVLDAVTGGKLILLTEDELRATLGEELMSPRPLDDAQAVSTARRAIADRVAPLVHDGLDSIMLAASEALTNAVKHGGGGEYAVYRSGDCLQIVIRDHGHGIDLRSLPKATLIQGFSTTSTMGLGFTIMLEVADRVLLTTDTLGTAVVLEIETPGLAARTPERSLAEILAV